MNIMLIARGYPSDKYKMNGIFELDQAIALRKAGHNVFVVAIDTRSVLKWRKWGTEKLYISNVPIVAFNIPLGRVPLSVKNFFSSIALRRVYKTNIHGLFQPDVIHAHFSKTAIFCKRISNHLNIPLILTEHLSTLLNQNIDNKTLKIAKKAYSISNEVIVVSDALQKVLKGKFNTRSHLIYNVIDNVFFDYCVDGVDSDVFRFITVGNLIKRKGMCLTIEAFYEFNKIHSNSELIIIGNGVEMVRLVNLVKSLNLDDKVRFKGSLSRESIAKYFSNSHAFVLSSYAETFGLVYVEAMAVGLPVIATKCGGPESFVNKDNGLLVEKGSILEITKAMYSIKSYYSSYNHESIRKYAYNLFSEEALVQNLIEVYKKSKQKYNLNSETKV